MTPNVAYQDFRINDHSSQISRNYASHGAQETVPSYQSNNAPIRRVAAPEPIKKIDFSSLQNYNTAPRGWARNENIYRPITFSSYSDF